jgi:hypothetical protein
MPKTFRPKPLYQRGEFKLHRWEGRENLVIVHYDRAAGRERIASAGTADIDLASQVLDRMYVETKEGANICKACGQIKLGTGPALVTDVIADYLISHAEEKDSSDAIRHRLKHVVAYIATLPRVPFCEEIDIGWVEKFRKWFIKQPIVTPTGIHKQRSISTVENSVLQLAAAINWGQSKGLTTVGAKFRPHPSKSVNRAPQFRADVSDLARMFAYATDSRIATRRKNLLKFLRISVATLARPDAAHDVSTDPARDQWNSAKRILNLNPRNRVQTKKYRPTVPIIEPVAIDLDATTGAYITVESVDSAFTTMMRELGLPGDGEAGMKLIRRSMADLLRDRLPEDQWTQIEMFLGHRQFSATSDLYAPFKPSYLSGAKAEIAKIAEEIEALAPGAFYHNHTTQRPALRSIAGGKNG